MVVVVVVVVVMMMMMMMSIRMVSHGRDSSHSVTGCCERSVEPSVSIKYGEFLE